MIQSFKKVTTSSFIIAFCLHSLTSPAQKNSEKDNLQYVDLRIGNVGQLLEPTRPTVQLPNQMMRMFPVRQD